MSLNPQALRRQVRNQLPRLSRFSAGMVDTGCASVATLVAGLYAGRRLDATTLGAYGVLALAFFAATTLNSAIYQPAEVESVRLPVKQRTRILRRSLPLGLACGAVIGLVVPAVATLLFGQGVDGLAQLAVTAGLLMLVSPAQDHIRRAFYQAQVPRGAAAVSIVHLICTAVAVTGGLLLGLPDPLVPFGGLVIANVISGAIGLMLLGRRLSGSIDVDLRLRTLLRTGRWIAYTGSSFHLTGMLAAILVARLAGAETAGYAEAARQVAQPMIVFGLALSATIRTQAMEAVVERNEVRGRGIAKKFAAVMLTVGALWLLLVGLPWQGNPMFLLLPKAYAVPGLVAAMVVTQVIASCNYPVGSQLSAAKRNKQLAKIATVAYGARLAVAATAGFTGPFAIPLGLGALTTLRSLGCRRELARMYLSWRTVQPTVNAIPSRPSALPPAEPAGARLLTWREGN